MGYYVNITDSTFTIPGQNVKAAYDRMVALNADDDRKRGGEYSEAAKAFTQAERDRLGYNPYKWFSWMDPDYPSKCSTTAEILSMLGFEFETDEDGTIHSFRYDSKVGQEGSFLDAISDLATGYIEWMGEDGARWREDYGKAEVVRREARIVWE